jgi:hypothetical protein
MERRAYEFFQNDKLDANGFFSNLAGRVRTSYRQNQFGAALGGSATDTLF